MEYKFPKDFIWGTASSAFQCEMGVSKEAIPTNTDWFVWTHSKEIKDEGLVSGDLPEGGSGFWDLYREDLERARAMNNNSIRLSIEWAKIFPDSSLEVPVTTKQNNKGDVFHVSVGEEGFEDLSSLVNWDAVNRYKEIFQYARSLGLSVFLTLYHWPLPTWLHDPVECHIDAERATKRGWLDKRTVVEFGKYAHFAAKAFGNLVDFWETLNEPWIIASGGYLFRYMPPAIIDVKKMMEVYRNLVFAHSVAYRNIKEVTANKPVGVGVDPQYYEPSDTTEPNVRITNYVKYFHNSEWFLDAAIFGKFDMNMDTVAEENRADEMAGADFIGVDYYRKERVSYDQDATAAPEILRAKTDPCQDCTDMGWEIYPEGIRTVTGEVFRKYKLPIYILENGIADSSDEKRSRYLVEHLKNLSLAINEDRVPVKGYYYWSLTDNFEWAEGFVKRFGLYRVNYETKERTPTKAVEIYREVCNTRTINTS